MSRPGFHRRAAPARLGTNCSTLLALLVAAMGVKGLSKNVIKLAWRKGRLADLPRDTRVGVDAMGWIHRAVVANAKDICLEQSSSLRTTATSCATCEKR